MTLLEYYDQDCYINWIIPVNHAGNDGVLAVFIMDAYEQFFDELHIPFREFDDECEKCDVLFEELIKGHRDKFVVHIHKVQGDETETRVFIVNVFELLQVLA